MSLPHDAARPGRRKLLAAAGAALALPFVGGARAQGSGWPNRPVTFVVPFPAGGGTDAFARPLTAVLTRSLGRQVIIDNRGGAGGTVGAGIAAKSAPDGYTFFMGAVHHTIAPSMYPKLDYSLENDFVPVGLISSVPQVVVVNPQRVAATDLKSFLDYVRKNPGKLNYGYTHAASGHMAMELLKQRASECAKGQKDCNGFFIVGIPYRGGGPMLQDLLGGQIPMMFINQDVALQHVRAGKLRPLACSSLQRNPLYPDVPTVHESGFPNFQALSWSGVSLIKGTPQPIVDRFEATMRKIMTSADIKQKLESVGFVVPPPGAQAYTQFVQGEIDLWTKVIKTAGIKPE